MTRRLLLGPALALLLAAPAAAATETISVARSVERDCTAHVLSAGKGVATKSFTAPREGTVFFRLLGGSRSGDWDLAAFDSAGSLIAGSKAFEANEVVEVNLRKGARITLQACRVSGRDRTVQLRTSFHPVDFEALEQTGPVQLVEVPISAKWQIDTLYRLGLDVTHDVHDGHAAVMLYGDRDRDVLLQTGFGFDVVRPDVLAAERAFRARDRRASASALPSGRTEYRTLEDVQQELKDMESQFPSLVRPFTLEGKTFQGRDIQAVEIGADADSEDDTRPVLFLNGIHHAREWPATEVIMEFAWDLLKNHKTDAELGNILENVRVVLQPYTNVDGFIVSRQALGQPEDVESAQGVVYGTATGVVILGGSFGYKRKNCNPYPATGPQPCEINIGTDNNRNYPHTWGGAGASTNPNDQSFRGAGPASEPETRAIEELHLSLNAPVLLSMHNIAAKVLRPPGTEAEGLAPDEEGLKLLGERMATPTGYANEFGHQLYDVTGGTKDWAYAVTGSFGYTIETGPASGDFHGPYEEVVVRQYTGDGDAMPGGMRAAFIAAAEWTREEQWQGRIAGRAPAGRTLRLRKDIATLSSPVCAIAGIIPLSTTQSTPDECVAPGDVIETPEKLDITTKVPASGRFTWWVNPSTRPYAKAPESYTLTCEDGGNVVETKTIVVGRGEVVSLDLPCGGTLPSGQTPAGTATVKVGAVKRAGRKARVTLTASGGTLSNVKVTLLRGRKAVARGRLSTLSGRRTVTVKGRRTIRKGRYTVRVAATGLKTVSRKLKVR